MKFTFSLRHTAIFLIFGAVVIAIINISTAIWLTANLTNKQAQSVLLDKTVVIGDDIKYRIARLHGALSDVGAATGYEASNAEEHFNHAQR